MKNHKKYIVLILPLILIGCGYEFPSAPEKAVPKLGTADFESYVVVGGAVSLGFMDGALYSEGQEYAYAAQMGRLLEEKFNTDIYTHIPIESENGYNINAINEFPNTPGKYELVYRSPTEKWPVRLPTNGEGIQSFSGNLTGVNNYSMPGLKIFQIDDETAPSGNVYFERLTEWPEDQSVLDVALRQNPTLLVLEAGITDVFNYSVEGARGENNPDPGNIQADDFTPVSVFEESLKNITDRILLESEADVFLFSIPDPFKLSYFTQLPWYFSRDEFDKIRQLNLDNLYGEFNRHVQLYNQDVESFYDRRPVIVFDILGGESFRGKVIFDEYLPEAQTPDGIEIPKYRQMTNEDYFLYNAQMRHRESIATDAKLGTETPVPDRYVITKAEIEIISERRNKFNTIIHEMVNSTSRLHLIDFEKLIDDVSEGTVSFNGVSYSLNFDYQGIISADGYSLNSKGQALLANLFIEYLNKNFSSNIPIIDVNSRPGNTYINDF